MSFLLPPVFLNTTGTSQPEFRPQTSHPEGRIRNCLALRCQCSKSEVINSIGLARPERRRANEYVFVGRNRRGNDNDSCFTSYLEKYSISMKGMVETTGDENILFSPSYSPIPHLRPVEWPRQTRASPTRLALVSWYCTSNETLHFVKRERK